MTIPFEDRAEFGSAAWVELARRHLQARLDACDDRVERARFSLSEAYSDPPPHLAGPDGRLAWFARMDGRDLEVGLGEIEGADMVVRGDYPAVLQIARTGYGNDEAASRRRLREVAHRLGGPAAVTEGTSASGPAAFVFAGLHDHLAVRTRDNPDLTHQTERQGLARAAAELDEHGYTTLERAVGERFADELRAAIIERAVESGTKTPGMLLERGSVFEEAALHPWLLTLAERLCGKGMLL